MKIEKEEGRHLVLWDVPVEFGGFEVGIALELAASSMVTYMKGT